MQKKMLMAVGLVPLLWGCDDATGPDGAGQVAVRFQAVSAAGAIAAPAAAGSASLAADPITLTGNGNTLVIEDIRLIVSEIELERADAECIGEDDDDDCEEFEGGPFLVNLLDGTPDQVVTALVPPGSYTEFEFEVEDLDDDDDDDDSERQVIQGLLVEMRQAYPGFPEDASMVVSGTWNGEPFTVYFDAEIEVELEFDTPFRVPEDAAILVNMDPSAWFVRDGQPINLAEYDGQTIEFELEFEMEDGFEIEHDD